MTANTEHRKLAAIMFTDTVGYSPLLSAVRRSRSSARWNLSRIMTSTKVTKNIGIIASSLVAGAVVLTGCSRHPSGQAHQSGDRSLVLALAVLGENDDGPPKTMPGQIGILT